ncbi:hypothetical protein RB195_025309 [Necator americanus]|uniref:Uncharacterized protein n=1 Tax=Necator americanus TaxID=51031 RepID=A0ABR1ERQ4_NECAM
MVGAALRLRSETTLPIAIVNLTIVFPPPKSSQEGNKLHVQRTSMKPETSHPTNEMPSKSWRYCGYCEEGNDFVTIMVRGQDNE